MGLVLTADTLVSEHAQYSGGGSLGTVKNLSIANHVEQYNQLQTTHYTICQTLHLTQEKLAKLKSWITIAVKSFFCSQHVVTRDKKKSTAVITLQENETDCSVVSFPPNVRAGCALLGSSQAEDKEAWAAAQA